VGLRFANRAMQENSVLCRELLHVLPAMQIPTQVV